MMMSQNQRLTYCPLLYHLMSDAAISLHFNLIRPTNTGDIFTASALTKRILEARSSNLE